LGTKGTTAS